jgi:phosphoglycerate dehydrogenase-like enzyme
MLTSAEFRDHVELHFPEADEIDGAIVDADVLVCGYVHDEELRRAVNLKWIAFWSAGLDGKLKPEMLQRGLTLTSASGVHGPNIADHVLMLMLMFTRRMEYFFRAQQQVSWARTPKNPEPGELAGKTLGIVGYGRIGEPLCQRAQACGMRVIATKRNPQQTYGTVKPDQLLASDELYSLLAESDHLCIAVPYTPATHHLIDESALNVMKPGSYLYNVARGKVLDEAAMVRALQNGHLAGAGLDVFETEPLSPDSALWHLENVLITPHVSGMTPQYFARFAPILAENIGRWLRNEKLVNQFDPARGY